MHTVEISTGTNFQQEGAPTEGKITYHGDNEVQALQKHAFKPYPTI